MWKTVYKYILLLFGFYAILNVQAQSDDTYYRLAREKLTNMLSGKDSLDLQRAVYWVEDAWYNNRLNESLFIEQIKQYADFCRIISESDWITYCGEDEQSVKKQAAVFAFITDSIPIQLGDSLLWHLPFKYNYEDFAGEKDWSNMFVSTLMQTRKGNCHSMPLLYKMIMNQLGEKCWLALAPNHMYVKARTRQSGWYNIELTTGDHPTDAWIMASGYIHLDAVRSGIYMDTLSALQEIALCLVDLAQGYQRKYPGNDGTFVWECCKTALKYYPDYINAMLIQADLMTKHYLAIPDKGSQTARTLKEEMNRAYTRIHESGYRKMPEKMYKEWLASLSRCNKKNTSRRDPNYH